MGRASALAGLGLLLACGDSSGGGSKGEATAAERLTELMHFEGGHVRSGPIAEPTNRTVMLTAAKGTVQLSPDQPVSILALDVDNPEDEPVTAMLLQFGDEDNHVEVSKDVEPSSTPTSVELPFEIDPKVCEGLCAKTYDVTLKQAAQLANDDVTEAETITIELDCTDDGDAELCGGSETKADTGPPPETDTGPPPEMDAGTDAAPEPDAGEPVDLTSLAAALSAAFAADQDALCMNCSDPSRIPCYAVVPPGAITCIEDAVTAAQGTDALLTTLSDFVMTVEGIQDSCVACDFDTCSPDLLDVVLPQLPTALADEIQACVTP